MARPRLLRTKDGGEITLKNVAPEIADKVKTLLNGGSVDTPVSDEPVEETPTTTLPFSGEYKSTGLGIFFDSSDKLWKVAILKFDAGSKTGVVEKIVPAGMDQMEASERFKILAADLNIVA